MNRFIDAIRQPAIQNPRLLGNSSAIQQLRKTITSLQRWNLPVLITGETGTGKEVVAHCLHSANAPRRGDFVTVDCAALCASLVENELFGHSSGAYTGAVTQQKGLIEAAEGGTLFLDEIGDLPLASQSRLLRVLQEREVRPVGAVRSVSVDIRVLAATNVDLELAVHENRFREDLYFRLSAMTIEVPPLRAHVEDAPLLAEYFLRWAEVEKALSSEAVNALGRYDWPGNVRELQNKIVRACVLSDDNLLGTQDLFSETEMLRLAGLDRTSQNALRLAVAA